MITFKPLVDSDIDPIVLMMQDFYAIDNYPIKIEDTKNNFKTFILEPNFGNAWLILNDNEIVGYVILTITFSFEYKGKIGFLDELFIIEKERNKGIGNKAIGFVLAECVKLSIKLIYLEIEKHNLKAQKVYLANGFEIHNRKLMKYKIKENN